MCTPFSLEAAEVACVPEHPCCPPLPAVPGLCDTVHACTNKLTHRSIVFTFTHVYTHIMCVSVRSSVHMEVRTLKQAHVCSPSHPVDPRDCAGLVSSLAQSAHWPSVERLSSMYCTVGGVSDVRAFCMLDRGCVAEPQGPLGLELFIALAGLN